jgi:hypothetical protein
MFTTIYDRTGNKEYWSEWSQHINRYINDFGKVNKEDFKEYMDDFLDYCEYIREHDV